MLSDHAPTSEKSKQRGRVFAGESFVLTYNIFDVNKKRYSCVLRSWFNLRQIFELLIWMKREYDDVVNEEQSKKDNNRAIINCTKKNETHQKFHVNQNVFVNLFGLYYTFS